MEINFDFSSLNMGAGFSGLTDKKERLFIRKARIKHKPCMYRNAMEMAQNIDPTEDYFSIVAGSFVYGDFIEALCDVHNLQPRRILITTLGLGKENIDSIVNLVDYLGVESLGLVVSTYFYGTERRNLVPYMISEFKGKPVRVAVCASHTKLCLIESEVSGNITMFGSANLSSSDNLEEFALIHDPGVFRYCGNLYTGVLRDFTVYDGLTDKVRFEKLRGHRGKALAEKAEEYAAGKDE